MKEEYFIYLGVFGVILIAIMINSYFLKKPKVEGLENMNSDGNQKDTLGSNSKDHLDKLKQTHESVGNKVLATNEQYKKNYGETAVTLHDIINKIMVMKMNSIYPDDPSDVVLKKLGELNTLYQSKTALNDVVANLDKH
jgi:hypothetical protein